MVQRVFLAMALVAALWAGVVSACAAAPTASAAVCQYVYPEWAGGILIMERHGISCRAARRLAARQHRRGYVGGGWHCHRVNINAGGGAKRCLKGSRSFLMGFE